jgi:hypothetical protein
MDKYTIEWAYMIYFKNPDYNLSVDLKTGMVRSTHKESGNIGLELYPLNNGTGAFGK